MEFKLRIGMRKIKSFIAVLFSFLIWQIIRIFFPMLEVHPAVAYIYSVLDMKENSDQTKRYGKLRIKATLVGLFSGLVFITLSYYVAPQMPTEILKAVVEVLFVALAVLCTLCIAEVVKCQELCGIAAMITVICMISRTEDNIYLYAVMRVVETLIGVFSAMVINEFIRIRNKKVDKR